MDEKMAMTILSAYKIHNADVLIREDITVDDFIDALEALQLQKMAAFRRMCV